jgi:hypothetical protein
MLNFDFFQSWLFTFLTRCSQRLIHICPMKDHAGAVAASDDPVGGISRITHDPCLT